MQKVNQLIPKRQGIGDIAYKGGWRISYYDIMPKKSFLENDTIREY